MPAVQVGDTVKVHVKVKEGARERIQVYEGIVIAKKHGGIEETITVLGKLQELFCQPPLFYLQSRHQSAFQLKKVPPSEIFRIRAAAARELRETDNAIQNANWTTEL